MRFLPSRTDRRAFGQIAEEYDLVYFGTVDPQIDMDYKMVHGLTMSPKMKDQNYTTGNVYDYEVAFLQRNRKVCLSDFCRRFKWTILQVQLKSSNLPHIVVASKNMTIYGKMLLSALRLSEIGQQNFAIDTNFAQKFTLYAQPQNLPLIQQSIMTPEVQTMLMTYFTDFSYELQGNKLIIYSTNQNVDLQILDHLLRIGLWWARYIDQSK
jgi:hypothetical protein